MYEIMYQNKFNFNFLDFVAFCLFLPHLEQMKALHASEHS